MRAERFHADTKIIAVEDIPIPEPGPGEVLVQVEYCGICHSDLSLINGTFPPLLPVVTQGHEASGTIAKIGAEVTGWTVGDRVIPSAGRPCFQCRKCRRGDVTNCMNVQLMAFTYDGAWAEYTVALAGGLTRIPDNVPFDQAAILADAVSTPFGAVMRSGKVVIGESVGVWGVGGVGTHIVQLARLVGAVPIIAFDINPTVRERALELGADYAFDSREENLRAKVEEATGGRMFDVAFDSAGLQVTFNQALDFLTVGGRLVVVGLSRQEASLGSTGTFGMSQKQVIGHLGYQGEDIETPAELVSRGRLDLSRSISTIIPLEDIVRGVEMLENHEGDPIRILVRP